jgi:hypothetical protein
MMSLIIYIIGFSVSISFTKLIAYRAAFLCGEEAVRKNFVVLIVMLITTYVVSLLWLPLLYATRSIIITSLLDFRAIFEKGINGWITDIIGTLGYISWFTKTTMEDSITSGLPKHIIFSLWPYQEGFHPADPEQMAFSSLSVVPMLIRFGISIVFVGSFLLLPLVMRPVNLVWRRIVESDKPVFTLTFSGAAALATALTEAAKHL